MKQAIILTTIAIVGMVGSCNCKKEEKGTQPSPSNTPSYQLVWSDEFNGTGAPDPIK